MMIWNYRVVCRTKGRDGKKLPKPYYAVHEVYYDAAMNPTSCTVEPIHVGGDDPSEIETQLSQMLVDIERPPLDYHKIGSLVEDDSDDGLVEEMEALWGEAPSGPYDPSSPVHCAWEIFGRDGRVPSVSHISDLTVVRRDLSSARDELSRLHGSARRRSALRRVRLAISRLLDKIGL